MTLIQNLIFLLLTTYDLSEKSTWNWEIHDELIARGAKASYVSWRDPALDAETICEYSHVLFLTCDYYDRHINQLYKSITTKLDSARRQKPDLEIIIDIKLIRWNSNKTYLKELLDVGLPLPATDFVLANNNVAHIKRALSQRESNSPVVVKPSISASGVGTHLIRLPHHLTAADETFLVQVVDQPALSCLMLQDYMPQILNGEISMVYIAGQIQHTMIKIPSRQDLGSTASTEGF